VLVPPGAATSSLSDQAYHLLRDRIVTLALPPGSLVNERALVEETGLGRTPIREALRRLADDDLVEVYPRRGIQVGPVDVGHLGAISEMRVELEGVAARLAAQRAQDDVAAMETLLEQLEALDATPDERTLILLDQRIHRLIHRAARNPFLEVALDRAYVLALRLWFLALDRVPRLHDAVAEHQDLLHAIVGGDAERAETIARAHVAGFEQQIRQLL
jgi:DNA-binding GntR family transcriptional regulator